MLNSRARQPRYDVVLCKSAYLRIDTTTSTSTLAYNVSGSSIQNQPVANISERLTIRFRNAHATISLHV